MIIDYYQTIEELGIKGRKNTPEEFEKIGLPKDLKGQDVLDVGCNMGAFLVEAKKRGADLITGVEPNQDWRLLAEGVLTELYPDGEWTIHQDIKDVVNNYDLVLLLSVLHVCREPQKVLDGAWNKTRRLLIVEINDRLQTEQVKLPECGVLIGKNKDNRSVWHFRKL